MNFARIWAMTPLERTAFVRQLAHDWPELRPREHTPEEWAKGTSINVFALPSVRLRAGRLEGEAA